MLNEKSKLHGTNYDQHNNHSLGTYNANGTTIENLQRWNNILGYVLGISSVGLTVIMEGIMVYVLVKFYQTKDIPAPGRESPWAKNTTLWPTLLLLVSSLLTLLVDIGSMIAACCRKKKVENKITWLGRTIKVAKWVAVFILYRIGKTSRDLWGWSCDDRAAAIQQFYVTNLDFHALCTEQVSKKSAHLRRAEANDIQTYAWYFSIAETILSVVLMIAAFIFAFKLRMSKNGR